MSDLHDEYLDASSSSNRRVVIAVIATIVVIAAVLFVLQNTNEVDITFLFQKGRAPLYVVIIISMVLPSLLTMIASWLRRRRRRQTRGEHG